MFTYLLNFRLYKFFLKVLYISKSIITFVDDNITEKKYLLHTPPLTVNKSFAGKTHSFGPLRSPGVAY